MKKSKKFLTLSIMGFVLTSGLLFNLQNVNAQTDEPPLEPGFLYKVEIMDNVVKCKVPGGNCAGEVVIIEAPC